VLAAEHLLRFAGVDLRRQLVESAAEISLDWLPCCHPFDQHLQIVKLALERVTQLDVFLQPAAALLDLLRVGLVLPEVGGGGELLYLGELDPGACGVKDSSAGRRRGAPDPRTCEADRRWA
jgi:hypothetical protein